MVSKQTLLSALTLGASLTLTQPAVGQFTFLNIGHTNDSNTGVGVMAVGVAVSGNVACLAMAGGGLYVYDVSDPADPRNIARTNNGPAEAVAMAGHYAYACVNTGIRSYDVSDPTHPVCLGQTNHTWGDAYRIYVTGDYAYTTGEYQGLRLYNVSDPAHLLYVGQIPGPRIYDAVIRDNYAYVVGIFESSGFSGLRIYDLSDPANPVLIGQNTNQLNPGAIAVSGNYALMPAYMTPGGGLRLCDISDPRNPVIVTQNTNSVFVGTQNSVVVSGNYAITSDPFLQMFDISDFVGLSMVAQLSSFPYRHRDIAVAGNYLYAATGADGFRTYLLFPQLAVAPSTNNSVALSWPVAPAPGFGLQFDPTPLADTWSDVTNQPAVTSNRNLLNLPASAASRFFRLRSP